MISEVNREGAYANLRLPKLLRESDLDERDRGFVTELAYGTLRMQGKHDFAIRAKIDRKFEELDPHVVDLLRMGIHQIFEMRVPDHAATDSTVEIAKKLVGDGQASFINAVLRSILRDPQIYQNIDSDWAIKYSHPEWMVSAFKDLLGDGNRVQSLLAAHNAPVAPHLIAWPGKATREELLEFGGEAFTETRFGLSSVQMPGAYPAIAERRAGVQDLGSQIVSEVFFNTASATKIDFSLSWLDMCAGPGGKAAFIYNLLASERASDLFTANEPTAHRAELVSRVVPEEHIISHKGQDLPSLNISFDRILVDAPCTGLGALRRRPEARWRKSLTDLKELVVIQRELLDSAAKMLNPSGIIGYVTCSPHISETRAQVLEFLHSNKDFVLLSVEPFLSEPMRDLAMVQSDGTIQLWSDLHGSDSMFMALFSRISRHSGREN